MEKNTLFFDVGNVMVFFSYEKMIQKLAQSFQTTSTKVHSFIKENNLRDMYELGVISTEEFYQLFCSHFNKKISIEILKSSLNSTFSPNTDLIPLLQDLKNKHTHLIILSNTCASHFDFLMQTYPFLQLFDEKILSHQVNLRKPDQKIYDLALAHAKGKAFFIDDLKENVAGAKKAGLDAALFQTAPLLKQTLIEKGYL